MIFKFTGTGVALITPFNEDSSIDYKSLDTLLKHVVSNGVDYLVVNGTTGESATTNDEEKAAVLAYVKKANTSLPVVYGIGGNNTEEVLRKIKDTDFSGVTALLSVSPYYIKPSQEGIYQHYKKIAEASPVPVILYNVPGRTGTNIHPQTTIRLSEIENIIGIKESSSDILQSLEIMKHARKDFLVICGDDMLTLPVIALGGRGAISVLANAYPLQFSQMVNYGLNHHFKEATLLLQSFSTINSLMYEEGNPVGIKTVLKQLNITKQYTRLPMVEASAVLQKKIHSAMEEIK